MARYTGPACRLCRRLGEKLMLKGERCTTQKCALERRRMPPGQQRLQRRRRRMSDRGVQLMEKQKARRSYGIMERQFRRHFAEAERSPGITGENLLRILEMRLDNVVYRLGFAESRRQARQIVRHGHITLNGRKTDIPSCAVRTGDVIAWNQKSTGTEYYKMVAERIEDKVIPGWLSLDTDTLTGHVVTPPARSDVEIKLDDKSIVEYYSR